VIVTDVREHHIKQIQEPDSSQNRTFDWLI